MADLPASEQRALAKLFLQSRLSLDETLFIVALSGAPRESLQAIGAELRKGGVRRETRPKIAVDKSDRLMIEGRDSGVKIVSYSPLKLNNRGALWSYDRAQAAEVNFKSLLRALAGGRTSAGSRLLLPSAEASASGIASVALMSTGAVLLAFGLALLAVDIAIPLLTGVGAGAVIWGAGFGTYALYGSGNNKSLFAGALPHATCDDSMVTISYGDFGRLEIDKLNDKIEVRPAKGKASAEFGAEDSRALLDLAHKCKSADEAVKLNSSFSSALAEVKGLDKAPGAATQPPLDDNLPTGR